MAPRLLPADSSNRPPRPLLDILKYPNCRLGLGACDCVAWYTLAAANVEDSAFNSVWDHLMIEPPCVAESERGVYAELTAHGSGHPWRAVDAV